MYVCLLLFIQAIDPALDVDITHLLPGDGLLLQYHILRVPYHNTQLVSVDINERIEITMTLFILRVSNS